MIIKSLLDNDFYKFSMHQAIFHNYKNTSAKFRFICRNKNIDLSDYASEIKQEISHLCSLSLTDLELEFLKQQKVFRHDYLNYLKNFRLNFKNINVEIKDGNLSIEAEGPWLDSSLFEIYVLAIVNEVYFKYTHPHASEQEGYNRLQEKINLIKELNIESDTLGRVPFKLIDFGTRRRFSGQWQLKVNQELYRQLPNNFMGTSSVYVAQKLNIKPIGTFAHEWLQAHQVLASELINSQKQAFEVWLQEYQGQLGIALSDIYGTEPFLKDFSPQLANAYSGARHDSGDPFIWGEKIINHYLQNNIDPKTKTLVFSDGLDVPKAIALYRHFVDRINVVFGIGTNLTNDFGFPALNIVMKMVSCNHLPVAKISDEPSKAICDSAEFLQLLKTTFGINL